MVCANAFEKAPFVSEAQYETFIKLLAPFAPHITEELWNMSGHGESIHKELWPPFNAERLRQKEITLAVQVNGKVRAELPVSSEEDETVLKARALALEAVIRHTKGKSIVKIILIKQRLINIVTE
jgi:leucyl-tRNA synthetase